MQFTYRILDFEVPSPLIPASCLTKVHFRLGGRFDSSFLQIPHWPHRELSPLLWLPVRFLRTPLLSSTYSLLSGLWMDFHHLGFTHAGHTRFPFGHLRLILCHPFGINFAASRLFLPNANNLLKNLVHPTNWCFCTCKW